MIKKIIKYVKAGASKVQTWMADKQKKKKTQQKTKRLKLHRRHNLTRQTSLFNRLFFNRTIKIKFQNQTYTIASDLS